MLEAMLECKQIEEIVVFFYNPNIQPVHEYEI
jgi:predicted adenine nucleotide alpha hydrolase (AANH) superfamily ATPase